jgi:hypothetical protein
MTKWIKKLLCANKGHISKYLLVRCSGGGGRGTLGSSVSARSHSHESQAYYYQPKALISGPPWAILAHHVGYTSTASLFFFWTAKDFIHLRAFYRQQRVR